MKQKEPWMFFARLLVTGMAVAMASLASAEQTLATGDFNNDGKADLAIGVPSEDLGGTSTNCGAVHVLYGRGVGLSAENDDFWHQNKPGILETPEALDRFGKALAVGDFNNDGFDDLAIGVDEDSGVGAVQVLYGANNGLVVLNNQIWSPATTNGDAGADGFGDSLAAGDFNDDGFDDLAIGEPRDDVFGIVDAGSFTLIYGSAQGLGAGVQRWHQYSGTIADSSEASDNFATCLAAGDFDNDGFADLAVGVPGEDFGTVSDAGAAHVIYGRPGGLTDVGNQFWHQNSPNVADLRESGDRFGAFVAVGDFDNDNFDDLAIAAPNEKIDAQLNAGAVHVLYGRGPGLSANRDQFWHQNRGGILDKCETDDEFGFCLATGDFDGDGTDDLAIGIQNEAVDEDEEVEDAGAIAVLYGTPANGLTKDLNQFWNLDVQGVRGEAEGAHFGSAIAAGDFNNDGFADLAGAAPGESLDAVDNTGAVHVLKGSAGRLVTPGNQWWHQNVAGIADECETDDGFGGVP
jgi:hypothetical protein